MIGFAMMHGAVSPIYLVGFPFLLASAIWFIASLVVGTRKRFRFSVSELLLIGAVALNIALMFLPYPKWEHIDVLVCGPGDGGAEYLRELRTQGTSRAFKY